MEIQHDQSETKGTFFVTLDSKRVAEMTYSKAGAETIIIDHTQVSDVLKGQNVGKQLVAAAVMHARTNNLKIIPLCPFARSVFDKVVEYSDVLK